MFWFSLTSHNKISTQPDTTVGFLYPSVCFLYFSMILEWKHGRGVKMCSLLLARIWSGELQE